MTRQKSLSMRGPEGRPPNRQPNPEGLGYRSRRGSERRGPGTNPIAATAVSFGAQPTCLACPGLPWGVPWSGSAVLRNTPGDPEYKGEFDVSRRVRWMTSGGCGPVGAGHTNGAPQIRSAALGMTNKERVVVRKGRLLEERAVAGRKGRLLDQGIFQSNLDSSEVQPSLRD